MVVLDYHKLCLYRIIVSWYGRLCAEHVTGSNLHDISDWWDIRFTSSSRDIQLSAGNLQTWGKIVGPSDSL